MENSSIKKINIAGKVGYIISIFLIVATIAGMVGIGICTVGALAISDNEINIKMTTNVNVSSTGNFLDKLTSFIFIGGDKELNAITEKAKDGIKVDDKDISELSVREEDGGLIIDAKTNEISYSMKNIMAALITTFVFLVSVTVALFMLKALMKSLKNCKTPFAEDVIKNMTRFATSLVCVMILDIIISILWSALSTGLSYNTSVNLGSVLLVAVIYVLIVVFKYGAKLQQESDETL